MGKGQELGEKVVKIDLREFPALYINLDSALDKRESTERLLKGLEFKTIIRVPGVVRENDRVGVSLAHLHAVSSIAPPFTVFEDDIAVKNFQPIIELPDDADAFFLGNMRWGFRADQHELLEFRKQEDYPDLYRVYNMLGLHGVHYLTERYVKHMIDTCYTSGVTWNGVPHDIPVAKTMSLFNVFSTLEPMVYQVGVHEGNTNLKLTDYTHV